MKIVTKDLKKRKILMKNTLMKKFNFWKNPKEALIKLNELITEFDAKPCFLCLPQGTFK